MVEEAAVVVVVARGVERMDLNQWPSVARGLSDVAEAVGVSSLCSSV